MDGEDFTNDYIREMFSVIFLNIFLLFNEIVVMCSDIFNKYVIEIHLFQLSQYFIQVLYMGKVIYFL